MCVHVSGHVLRLLLTCKNISTAEPPKIVLSPESATNVIPCMDPVHFTVEATGREPIEYHWERRPADGEDSWKLLHPSDDSFEGVKSNTLTITTVQEHHKGEYRCVLRSPTGSTTSKSATLSLVNPGEMLDINFGLKLSCHSLMFVFSIDYVISQFLDEVCAVEELPSVNEIETFIQKFGAKSEVGLQLSHTCT